MKNYRSSKRKSKIRYSRVVSRTPETIEIERKRKETAKKNWEEFQPKFRYAELFL